MSQNDEPGTEDKTRVKKDIRPEYLLLFLTLLTVYGFIIALGLS